MPVILKKEREWLLQEKYGGKESEEFFADLERLVKGEPIAYIIGWVLFLNAKIWLDSHPLIPRPETEWWVENIIDEIRAVPNARILDLCAGSGAIGIAMLQAFPDASVDFIEKEVRHHTTIEKNVRENVADGAKRVRVLGGDLFENAQQLYDIILTNPPYIDPKMLENVQEGVVRHEPHEALFGGERGMEIIKRILADAPAHLASGGFLYIEHEPEQVGEISKIAASFPYASWQSFSDQFDVLRYTRLVCT